ncbi:MAG: hypothetical protein Tsb009_08760 [Planctomycetaceae bacterium]
MLLGVTVYQQGQATETTQAGYRIQLFRPAKPGDVYRLVATETKKQLMVISRDGKIQSTKSENLVTKFEGDVTILKVDEKGNTTSKMVVVESFVDGKNNPILKKGAVIIADTIDGKTVYRLKEGQISQQARERLSNIIRTKSKNKRNDDETFGSKSLRRIGEEWPVQKAAIASELKVDPQFVTGTVQLGKRHKIRNVDCLKINAQVKIKSFPEIQKFTQRGYRVVSPVIVVKLSGDFPVDPETGPLTRTLFMSTQTTLIGDKPAVKGIELKVSSEFSASHQRFYKN